MKIKDIAQISTGTGDKGTSRNYDNIEFNKDDILFEVLGTIDELSSMLGLCFQHTKEEFIKGIQRTLQDVNSLIATSDPVRRGKLKQISKEDIEQLEQIEQITLNDVEIGHEFVLPGSENVASAYYDLARTITRRAERRLVTFVKEKKRTDVHFIQVYLNRLSDLLFIIARKKR